MRNRNWRIWWNLPRQALLSGAVAFAAIRSDAAIPHGLSSGGRDAVAAEGRLSPDVGITVEEAVKSALAKNPRLAAAGDAIRAAEGSWRFMRTPPNPELSYEIEDFGWDLPAWSGSQATLSLNQTVETPGKRRARSEAGRFFMEGTAAERDIERLDLILEVKRRFALLLGAQQRLDLVEENARAAGDVASTVSALVLAGEVSPIEEARAEAGRSLAELDLVRSRTELQEARRGLSSLWGESEPSFERAEGELFSSPPPQPLDDLVPGVLNLPDMSRFASEVGRRRAELRQERLKRLPDFTFSLGSRRFAATRERAWTAGVSIAIPLFNRNSGGILEASARLDQGQKLLESEEVRLRAALLDAHQKAASAASQARLVSEEVYPKARQVYEAVLEGYSRGKFRLLDLLDALRILNEAKLRRVETHLALALSHAELERLCRPEASGPSTPNRAGGPP